MERKYWSLIKSFENKLGGVTWGILVAVAQSVPYFPFRRDIEKKKNTGLSGFLTLNLYPDRC